jgi:hypothetical protein
VKVRRWAANLAWTVAGIVLYFLCIDTFGGYPSIHSETLNLTALIVLILLGAFVWYRHERRDGDR